MKIEVGTEVGKALIAIGVATPLDQPQAGNVMGGNQTRVVDVGSGPYEGTGRDTSITELEGGRTVGLPLATSKNFRIPVGSTLALAVSLNAGPFRAGIGEYGDAGAAGFDLALSRVPHQIEDAPARSPNNITGVQISDDQSQLFSAGAWYLNVRVNRASTEGNDRQGFTISYYQ